jgi:Rho termination factor, N-terminal domain
VTETTTEAASVSTAGGRGLTGKLLPELQQIAADLGIAGAKKLRKGDRPGRRVGPARRAFRHHPCHPGRGGHRAEAAVRTASAQR